MFESSSSTGRSNPIPRKRARPDAKRNRNDPRENSPGRKSRPFKATATIGHGVPCQLNFIMIIESAPLAADLEDAASRGRRGEGGGPLFLFHTAQQKSAAPRLTLRGTNFENPSSSIIFPSRPPSPSRSSNEQTFPRESVRNNSEKKRKYRDEVIISNVFFLSLKKRLNWKILKSYAIRFSLIPFKRDLEVRCLGGDTGGEIYILGVGRNESRRGHD